MHAHKDTNNTVLFLVKLLWLLVSFLLTHFTQEFFSWKGVLSFGPERVWMRPPVQAIQIYRCVPLSTDQFWKLGWFELVFFVALLSLWLGSISWRALRKVTFWFIHCHMQTVRNRNKHHRTHLKWSWATGQIKKKKDLEIYGHLVTHCKRLLSVSFSFTWSSKARYVFFNLN